VKNVLCKNIQNKSQGLSLNNACQLTNLSKHAFHNWLKPKPVEPEPLLELIQAIKKDPNNRRYGYRPVTILLQRQHITVNHKKVLKIMKKHDLIAKTKKFRICTTNSNHNLLVYPNLIKGLEVTRLNQVWVADITYILLANKKYVYLAVVMDRYSRRFLGWQISERIDEQLSLDALHMAFETRKGDDLTNLIHHSDQGVQYAANEYTGELKERRIQISMSRKGNPYDNAHMERAMRTIKEEEVYMDEYNTIEDAHRNLKHFIEKVYNKKRLHSTNGYLPPVEFENQYKLKEVAA